VYFSITIKKKILIDSFDVKQYIGNEYKNLLKNKCIKVINDCIKILHVLYVPQQPQPLYKNLFKHCR